MADRFFPNVMPDFVPEKAMGDDEVVGESLTKALFMPYQLLSEQLKRAALDLKEAIVMETWELTGQRVNDFTLYTGLLGTAFLLFRAYQIMKNPKDLTLCSQIVKGCDFASHNSRNVTFICGKAGVYALGAVVSKELADAESLNYYLNQFRMIRLSSNLPDELLYGRVGYLWACLFLNKHLGDDTIPASSMREVINEIMKNGRSLARRGRSPLMFEWYGEKYWGAAHGLAGIMRVLMEMELKPDEAEDVKGTLRYMIENRFHSGNYPAAEEDRGRDILVHWCHGAPGMALTLTKAAKVFGDEEFQQAAAEAAEVVWKRGLLRRVGICHGISGNAYVFLSLYQATGKAEYLYKAKAFTCFLLDKGHELIAKGEMHGGDCPYSLFEGIAGMAYLFVDMLEPSGARFPAYEL
ncbi:hypothetical protein SAY87_030429 [Trapa incisa]|uniref:LanC-like protein GCL2 n=1 Tax=Trapa incisa TaxID=236973 RepID=A0AAN7KVN1_9MYRT|nr:hypothetical protein SAY87_030429 [Trapa incisa]